MRYVGHQETPVNSNRSWAVDYWLRECRVEPGLPWCAAFVSQMGRQALGVAWPAPRAASVQRLVDWATSMGCIHHQPRMGDLFALYMPNLNRYAHVGVVEAPEALTPRFRTIEGNTNPSGGRDGYGVFRRTRPVTEGTAFIRWVETLGDG